MVFGLLPWIAENNFIAGFKKKINTMMTVASVETSVCYVCVSIGNSWSIPGKQLEFDMYDNYSS